MNDQSALPDANLNTTSGASVSGNRASWQCPSCLAHNIVHYVQAGQAYPCGLCGNRVELTA